MPDGSVARWLDKGLVFLVLIKRHESINAWLGLCLYSLLVGWLARCSSSGKSNLHRARVVQLEQEHHHNQRHWPEAHESGLRHGRSGRGRT